MSSSERIKIGHGLIILNFLGDNITSHVTLHNHYVFLNVAFKGKRYKELTFSTRHATKFHKLHYSYLKRFKIFPITVPVVRRQPKRNSYIKINVMQCNLKMYDIK